MIRYTPTVGAWLAVTVLLGGGVLKAAPTAATPGAGQKGFEVADESRSLPVSDTAPPSNAGLFVGVNKFTVDDGLRPLQFAVDDAIAQANLFVLELKLVTAANCYLAISGDPSSDESKRQLGELTKAGVHVVTAERTHVLHALLTVKDLGHSSRDIPGFHFGRIDVRYGSEAALRLGRDFTIIEVNGAGSEATHIWDARCTLREAYATQFAHYRAAWEIGRVNRAAGHRPSGLRTMYEKWRLQRRLMASYPTND